MTLKEVQTLIEHGTHDDCLHKIVCSHHLCDLHDQWLEDILKLYEKKRGGVISNKKYPHYDTSFKGY